MANSTVPIVHQSTSEAGTEMHAIVGSVALPEGVMVAQLSADATLVNPAYGTTGAVIGVMQHSAAIAATGVIETERCYVFDNSSGSPCSASTKIGAAVFAEDNHTIAEASGGNKVAAGTFMGMDGTKVRVKISPFQPAPATDATNIAALQVDAATAHAQIELDITSFTKADGTPLAKWSDATDGTCGIYGDGTKVLGVRWNKTAGTTETIAKGFKVPFDCDVTVAPVVYIKAAKVGATLADAVTFVVGLYAQTKDAAYDGGANLGATTDAMVGDDTTKHVQLVHAHASAFPDVPSGMCLTINPTAAKLVDDDVIITHAWVEYTRKVLTS